MSNLGGFIHHTRSAKNASICCIHASATCQQCVSAMCDSNVGNMLQCLLQGVCSMLQCISSIWRTTYTATVVVNAPFSPPTDSSISILHTLQALHKGDCDYFGAKKKMLAFVKRNASVWSTCSVCVHTHTTNNANIYKSGPSERGSEGPSLCVCVQFV